jgi:hypothetical protein
MKKILFVFAAGIVIMSCNDADKTADASNSAASTNSSVTANHSDAPNTSNAQVPTVDTSKITKIEWLDGINRDFGKMKLGDKLDVTFRFKNIGDKPLIIRAVNPGCGCTVAEKPEKPIAPGETGEIKASFNSEGQGPGEKSKNVNVFANTDPEMTSLIFRVNVKEKG